MTPSNLFPWQQTLWDHLTSTYQKQKLTHAILLADREGLGQEIFAQSLARYILGEASQPLFDSGNHPDFFELVPEEAGAALKIEGIRDLQTRLSGSAQVSHARVVILNPAHALNRAASNAFLKLLEEPPSGVFFILMSSRPASLSKTILSRCQRFYFGSCNKANAALSWLGEQGLEAKNAAYFLKLADGAPMKALALSEKSSQQFRKEFLLELNAVFLSHTLPSTFAEKWAKKQSLPTLLEWIGRWLSDAVRLHQNCLVKEALPQAYVAILKEWQAQLNLEKLFEMIRACCHMTRLASEIKGLNAQNSLESILLCQTH